MLIVDGFVSVSLQRFDFLLSSPLLSSYRVMCCLLVRIAQNEFKSDSYTLQPEQIDGSKIYRISFFFLGNGMVEQPGM